MTFMLGYIWFRATFPRFRFDQLMDLGWKWMIPLALGNIVVTGVVVLAVPDKPYIGETVLSAIGIAIILFTLFLLFRPRPKVTHASRVSEA
jgi:NADH-quinone oxidoreductase subunit H